MNLFITGGTGFIGKAILARYYSGVDFEKIYVLMRAENKAAAQDRLQKLVTAITPIQLNNLQMPQLIAIPGDFLEHNLITLESDYEELVKNVTHILHIGASTDFGAPIEVSRTINVAGTQKVLDLALACQKNGGLERLDYISTAFVAGKTKGVVNENQLSRGQDFANAYEQSKYEAEILVRSYLNQIPITIYRPSIVVGDSKTGYTPHFKVLYWPLRLIDKPFLKYAFVNLKYKVDIVPCDFVAKAIVALAGDKSTIGETYHLTAGLGNEVKMGKVLQDAYRYAGLRRKIAFPFWFKHFLIKTWLGRLIAPDFVKIQSLVSPYESYLRGMRVTFSNKKTTACLKKFSIAPPAWDNYAETVLKFCTESAWGRSLKMPEHLYYKTMWEKI